MMSPRCSRFLSRDPLGKVLLTASPKRSLVSPSPSHQQPHLPPCRKASTQSLPLRSRTTQGRLPFSKNATSAYYATAVLIGFLGLTYAAVPIYRIVCQKTGWAGTPVTDSSKFTPEHMVPVPTASGRRIKVSFSASTSDTLPWSFKPQQREISLLPGETALAFYKARNWGKEDIIGIATYNVNPAQVAPYFNKIQCFCFEEQKLAAGEEVDMPVFFFLDSDFVDDPQMKRIDSIVLSYTFFKARYDRDGHLVPMQA